MEVTIALAQYPVTKFETLTGWQNHIREWVKTAVKKSAEILVFPEYASMELVSLFSAEIQADIEQQIVELQTLLFNFKATFRSLAAEFDCIIIAPTFPVFEEEIFVNRAFVFSKENEGFQDKWFMTRFENEVWGISSGKEKALTIFESDHGSFGIQICYDIEFPVGSQILAANNVDLIFAPSCTETLRGATRVHIGARARAMEQQIYTGVSQLIENAKWSPAVDINYGYGGIYSSADNDLPMDGIIKISEAQKPEWLIETLDLKKNEVIKNDGQVFNFADSQKIKMTIGQKFKVNRCKL